LNLGLLAFLSISNTLFTHAYAAAKAAIEGLPVSTRRLLRFSKYSKSMSYAPALVKVPCQNEHGTDSEIMIFFSKMPLDGVKVFGSF